MGGINSFQGRNEKFMLFDDMKHVRKKYSKEERLKLAKSNADLCKFIAKQKINVGW